MGAALLAAASLVLVAPVEHLLSLGALVAGRQGRSEILAAQACPLQAWWGVVRDFFSMPQACSTTFCGSRRPSWPTSAD
jgi:hypothetical protein